MTPALAGGVSRSQAPPDSLHVDALTLGSLSWWRRMGLKEAASLPVPKLHALHPPGALPRLPEASKNPPLLRPQRPSVHLPLGQPPGHHPLLPQSCLIQSVRKKLRAHSRPPRVAARGAVSPVRPQGLTCQVAPGVPAHSKAMARTLGGGPQPLLSPGQGPSPAAPAPSRHTGSSAQGC